MQTTDAVMEDGVLRSFASYQVPLFRALSEESMFVDAYRCDCSVLMVAFNNCISWGPFLCSSQNTNIFFLKTVLNTGWK